MADSARSRHGEQRIRLGARAPGIGVCRGDELGAARPRQRGGEDDDRAAQREQLANETRDERAGIDIVAVDFIEDDDLPREAEAAHEEVLYRHDALERLIDGADAEAREQSMLRRGKP